MQKLLLTVSGPLAVHIPGLEKGMARIVNVEVDTVGENSRTEEFNVSFETRLGQWGC